jgi:hypothetical protein
MMANRSVITLIVCKKCVPVVELFPHSAPVCIGCREQVYVTARFIGEGK